MNLKRGMTTFRLISMLFMLVIGTGCNTDQIVGGLITTTIVGGITPSNEIEQIYYLGVFDPYEQIPSTIYRVRVRGQASAFSNTKFASGWVPANLIDSLGTQASFNTQTGLVNIDKGDESLLASMTPERRMMLFGPEGFREAPKDHRLVIVMGVSPEAFFNAIDTSLGAISEAQKELRSTSLSNDLFKALEKLKSEREALNRLEKDVEVELAMKTGEGN